MKFCQVLPILGFRIGRMFPWFRQSLEPSTIQVSVILCPKLEPWNNLTVVIWVITVYRKRIHNRLVVAEAIRKQAVGFGIGRWIMMRWNTQIKREDEAGCEVRTPSVHRLTALNTCVISHTFSPWKSPKAGTVPSHALRQQYRWCHPSRSSRREHGAYSMPPKLRAGTHYQRTRRVVFL